MLHERQSLQGLARVTCNRMRKHDITTLHIYRYRSLESNTSEPFGSNTVDRLWETVPTLLHAVQTRAAVSQGRAVPSTGRIAILIKSSLCIWGSNVTLAFCWCNIASFTWTTLLQAEKLEFVLRSVQIIRLCTSKRVNATDSLPWNTSGFKP